MYLLDIGDFLCTKLLMAQFLDYSIMKHRNSYNNQNETTIAFE